MAWLDSVTTAAEVILLLRGKAWGEWLVAAGLGALVVVEVVSLERRPSLTRLVVLIVNAAVVAYLVARRSREVKRRTQDESGALGTTSRSARPDRVK